VKYQGAKALQRVF